MSLKEKINWYSFVELPDYKIRYLIRDSVKDPIAVLRFEDDGTPNLRYLKPVPLELEMPILEFMNDRQKLLFGN
jgi:hypothetical protein